MDEARHIKSAGQTVLLDSLVGRFAVAVTRTKDLGNKINVESQIFDLEAHSSDEAIGIATRLSNEDHPGHQIMLTTWIEIVSKAREGARSVTGRSIGSPAFKLVAIITIIEIIFHAICYYGNRGRKSAAYL